MGVLAGCSSTKAHGKEGRGARLLDNTHTRPLPASSHDQLCVGGGRAGVPPAAPGLPRPQPSPACAGSRRSVRRLSLHPLLLLRRRLAALLQRAPGPRRRRRPLRWAARRRVARLHASRRHRLRDPGRLCVVLCCVERPPPAPPPPSLWCRGTSATLRSPRAVTLQASQFQKVNWPGRGDRGADSAIRGAGLRD
jgi:hypothetical protein